MGNKLLDQICEPVVSHICAFSLFFITYYLVWSFSCYIAHVRFCFSVKWCSGKVQRQFVPLKQILAAVINEAVTPTSCYYYLALLIRDESKLVLAFKVCMISHGSSTCIIHNIVCFSFLIYLWCQAGSEASSWCACSHLEGFMWSY